MASPPLVPACGYAGYSERLSFHSPVFAGIALALIVGLPASVLAALSWRRHPRTPDATALAGLLLVGWIAVEIAAAREFSALQVVYAAAGAGLNLGRASARTVLPGWQTLRSGDIAAPMANPPTPATSFVIADAEPPEEEHEVTLRAERPVVAKEAAPVERVRLSTETVTEEHEVNEQVRKEQIEQPDIDPGTPARFTEVTPTRK